MDAAWVGGQSMDGWMGKFRNPVWHKCDPQMAYSALHCPYTTGTAARSVSSEFGDKLCWPMFTAQEVTDVMTSQSKHSTNNRVMFSYSACSRPTLAWLTEIRTRAWVCKCVVVKTRIRTRDLRVCKPYHSNRALEEMAHLTFGMNSISLDWNVS